MVCIPSENLGEFTKVPEYALIAYPEYAWIGDFKPSNLTSGSNFLKLVP